MLRSAEAIQTAATLLPTAVRQYIRARSSRTTCWNSNWPKRKFDVRETEKNASRGTMTSPVDGIVLERAVSNERQVSAGTVLVRIGRWEDLEIEADVLSQDVVRVKPGQTVEVHGAAIGQQPATAIVSPHFSGRLYQGQLAGSRAAAGESHHANGQPGHGPAARAQRPGGRLSRSGANLHGPGHRGASRAALGAVSRAEERLAAVRRAGRPGRLVTVKIGLANDEKVQILSGLAEGDQVILRPRPIWPTVSACKCWPRKPPRRVDAIASTP